MKQPELSFADKMKLSAVKPFVPMVRPAAQKFFNELLTEARQQLHTDGSETEAAIVCFTTADGTVLFLTAALDAENKIVRIISRRTLDELVTSLTNLI